jgi:hypothetical protein
MLHKPKNTEMWYTLEHKSTRFICESLSLMDTIRREKKRIQKRMQIIQVAGSLLLLVAFLVPATLTFSMARSSVAFIHEIFSTDWFFLFPIVLFLFIFGLGISQLGPSMQKTQRQKEHWLNEYGRHILAQAAKYPEENALVIGSYIPWHRSSYQLYLNWQDPQTEQLYAFPVSTRFSPLRKLQEGALCPVQFDPSDPTFFCIPAA